MTRRGRPSKGPRDAIQIRPTPELGALLRREGRQNRITAGEYVVSLLARQFDLPHFVPQPSLGAPERYSIRPHVVKGRDSITVRPPLEFGLLIKAGARNAGLSYGAYVVEMIELILLAQHEDDHTMSAEAPIRRGEDLGE